jgi:hypothetical protein
MYDKNLCYKSLIKLFIQTKIKKHKLSQAIILCIPVILLSLGTSTKRAGPGIIHHINKTSLI